MRVGRERLAKWLALKCLSSLNDVYKRNLYLDLTVIAER